MFGELLPWGSTVSPHNSEAAFPLALTFDGTLLLFPVELHATTP